MLVVKDVALRLAIDRPWERGACDVNFAWTDRRGVKKRRAAVRAEAAAALLRRLEPFRLRRAGQDAEALLGRAHPGHEGRAVGFAAIPAVTVGDEQRRRRHRESNRAAEAATLEIAHAATLAKNAIHMPKSRSVLAT